MNTCLSENMAGIFAREPFVISNSTIVDPPGAGLRHPASDTTDYAGNGNDLGPIVTY